MPPFMPGEALYHLPSRTILSNFLHDILLAISTEIHPSIGGSSVADDVPRRRAGRLSNVRTPLARVVSRGALQPGALVSHGRKVGRTLVGGEGLAVDDGEVEPRLAVGSVDSQLQLVLVGGGDLGVWGALHDGADVVL